MRSAVLVDSYSFLPSLAGIPGLARAWRSDAGVTIGVDGITSVAGAYGTAVALTGTGAACPDVAAGIGPVGQALIDFNAADSEQFTMPSFAPTDFSFVVVVAPKTQGTPQGIFGQGAAGTMYAQLGAAANKVQVRAGAGDVNHDLTLPRPLAKNLEVIGGSYNRTTGVFIPYLDGEAGTGFTAAGLDFVFDKIGALGATANDLNAYVGVIALFDRALTAVEMRAAYNILAPSWKGNTVWVSTSGSDSSTTPWLRATPLLTPSTAIEYAAHSCEVALKGGDVFRQVTDKLYTRTPGLSATRRNKMSGGRWGTGKAQIRYSNAPNVSVTSGTIYQLAGTWTVDSIPAGLNPGVDFGYIYYVPGGTPTFPRDGLDVSTNVVRLTYQAATPTTPASGKWGFDSGTGLVYVNAGVALANGDIEVPQDSVAVSSLVNPFHILDDNWEFSDIVVAFAEDKGCSNLGRQNIKLTRFEAWFVGSDGFDGFDDGANLCRNFEHFACIAAWCGRGPTIAGSFGDGYSLHDTAQADYYWCQSWHCDKSGAVHQAPSVSRLFASLHIGSQCYRHAENAGQVGSMLMQNCIGIVPAGALRPNAVQNTCLVNSPLTVVNGTFVSLSGGLAGSGVFQTHASGAITLRNSIIKGFLTGLTGASGTASVTADHNCYHGNGTNYANVLAGSGDIFVDPLFADFYADLTLSPASPCIGAGMSTGVLRDYSDALRSTSAPSIGAYE